MQKTPISKQAKTGEALPFQPRRLGQVILAIMAMLGIAAVHLALAGDWLASGILLVVECLLWIARAQARQKRTRLAARFTIIVLSVSLASLVYLYGGIYDVAVSAFPALLIFAAMFVGLRFFVGLLVCILIFFSYLIVADVQGWHTNAVYPVSYGELIDITLVMLATAFFAWKMASDLRHALNRLETENLRIHQALDHIDELANNDALTGLPNRHLARARFTQLIELNQRSDEHIAMMFLDLDNFKTVNDSLGHAAGDILIREVARRLKNAVRACDTVSRQGGDEFLIILPGQSDQKAVATVAAKIVEVVSVPFRISSMEVAAGCSLGVAMYPEDGHDFDTLLKHSDMAMYKAKESGRNTFRFYDVQMDTNVIEHLQLIAGIRSALLRGEFALHYQPQFELGSGRIIGAEALIRWDSPELGNIQPNKFIPVAERSGQIHEIGSWVIAQACQEASRWRSAGLNDLILGINLSPVQFRRDNLEQDLVQALETAGLPAQCVELELTESLLIVDSEHIRDLLVRIHALGVHLSIDDFGTGYSNLGYLTRFAVERLKIDQSFIRRMTEYSDDQAIVRAIIEMAHSLKLEVVAEGVENQQVLDQLIEMGCEHGQGYHWSPALPPEQFYQFVMDWNSRRTHAPADLSLPG